MTGDERNKCGNPSEAVPVRVNRAYKFSYWVKALNDSAVGTAPGVIVEYNGKQTDYSQDKQIYYPNYDYSYHRTELVAMTKEWQKIEFIYKVEGVTRDICLEPTIYFRLFTMDNKALTADGQEYLIDEIKMEELPIIHDGDFSADPNENPLNNRSGYSKYKYAWGDDGNSIQSVHWIDAAGADAQNGYIQFDQVNMKDLQTYVDLEEGETYKISYWAKLDNWATQETSELKDTGVYILPIFSRARSDLDPSETYNTKYQNVTCLNSENSNVLTDDWQQFEGEFTVPVQNEGVLYRSAYVQFRLGTGRETLTYSLDNVKIEKVAGDGPSTPALSNLTVAGTAIAGTALEAAVDYSCASSAAGYIFRVYAGNSDADYAQAAYVETQTPVFRYTPNADQIGKKLKFEVRAIAANGEYSNVLTYETEAVLPDTAYITGDEAAFSQNAWATKLSSVCKLTAGEGGAIFNCMIAVYDEEGSLMNVIAQEKKLTAMTKEDVPLEISVPRGAYKAKLMVWGDLNGSMAPYCAADELINQ